ncbi:MAG: tetratricopeptide repeat protein [Longimicrobiales bacterium]
MRLGRTAVIVVLAVASSGCATKRDVRDLRDAIVRANAKQDSVLFAVQRQNRALLDSIADTRDLLRQFRGDVGNRFTQIEEQLVQVQELTGQSQRRLAELREQIAESRTQFAEPPPTEGTPAAEGGGDVEELYQIGMENLQRGAAGTARAAFEEIVAAHQGHPRAPDAQYGLGEAYYQAGDGERALREFERVVELFPSAPAAPRALYRAGVIAAERGNNSRAREYFTRVMRGYPNSDEARSAAAELRRIGN